MDYFPAGRQCLTVLATEWASWLHKRAPAIPMVLTWWTQPVWKRPPQPSHHIRCNDSFPGDLSQWIPSSPGLILHFWSRTFWAGRVSRFISIFLPAAWRCKKYGIGLAIYRSHVQSLAISLSRSDQVIHTCTSVHQTVEIGTHLGWCCSEAGKVTAGPVKCNGSLLLGLWRTSSAGCLPRKPGVSSGP